MIVGGSESTSSACVISTGSGALEVGHSSVQFSSEVPTVSTECEAIESTELDDSDGDLNAVKGSERTDSESLSHDETISLAAGGS